MKEILQDGYGYVGSLLRSFDEVTSVFYGGDEYKIGGTLLEVTEGFQWLFLVLGKNPFVDITEELEIIATILPQVETCVKEKDYSGLGDLFQYELYFILLRIHEKVEKGLIEEDV